MNDRIQRLGLILGVGFCLLLAALTRLQVVDASKLSNDPRNTRALTASFSADRGSIQTADGVLLARSVPASDEFKRQRQYPEGPVFAPVTGYLSFTFGADGAERAFNDALTGGGSLPKGDDALRQLFQHQHATRDVTLTINAAVQRVAATALGTRRGAVVALNPTTGAILALASYPSFDPNPLAAHSQDAVRAAWNTLQNDASHPLLPRGYRESYPPGSTFKVVTASAAFDHKPDITTKVYPTLNALPLPHSGGLSLHNFGGEHCGGNIAEMIRISCNTGMASVGLDVGGDGMAAEAQAFGFGTKPPLDLPATAVSHFPAAAEFTRNEPALAFDSIGQQNVSATPLQMALIAAGIANGGVIMTPHVLDHTSDAQGNVIDTYKPHEWRTATSGATAAVIKQMMIDVARRGTATRAQIAGIVVAAKTGTAQTGKEANHAHAWLIAFAPAEAPKIAVAVIVEDQSGLGDTATGGRVAAPIAQQVMRVALGL